MSSAESPSARPLSIIRMAVSSPNNSRPTCSSLSVDETSQHALGIGSPPTCSFWRLSIEIWGFQKVVHKRLMHLSSNTHFSILVILFLSTRKISHSSVYEDISRPSIEIIGLVDPAVLFGRHKRTVPDAADVLTDSVESGMYEGECILEARQRRTLSTNLLLRGSEIIHRGLPSPVGIFIFSCSSCTKDMRAGDTPVCKNSRLAHHQRRFCLSRARVGLMPNCLAMARDQIDIL